MKRNTLIAGVAVLGLVAGAGAVLAHGKKMGRDGMHGGMHDMRGGPMLNFEEIDTDGDGKLTKTEVDAHAQARFKAADADGNGKLSPEEMQAAAKKRAEERRALRAERMVARMIERMDADNDGELSFDEMPGRKTMAERMFDRVDSDGDGAISKEEMAAAREKRGEHRGDGSHHGEGGHHGKRWMDD